MQSWLHKRIKQDDIGAQKAKDSLSNAVRQVSKINE